MSVEKLTPNEVRGVERLRAELIGALLKYKGSGVAEAGWCETCGPNTGSALTSEDVNRITNELVAEAPETETDVAKESAVEAARRHQREEAGRDLERDTKAQEDGA